MALIQTPIEDIASLNIHRSQALDPQDTPTQVEGELYPRRRPVKPGTNTYPPFLTNLFFAAFTQAWVDDEWVSLDMSYRSKVARPAVAPSLGWLSDKSAQAIDDYLDTHYDSDLNTEHFGWHIDEDSPESINMEIRENDNAKQHKLLMRVHFTPTLVQEGDHVLVGRREFIVDAMDTDNINLLSTAKPKAGSRAKREYYSPNDFFEALATGDIQLIQPDAEA